jgi:surfactin synthase thioesterase subunit
MGALIAFNLARRLWKNSGNKPGGLLVGAYSSPSITPNPRFGELLGKFQLAGFNGIPYPDSVSSFSSQQCLEIMDILGADIMLKENEKLMRVRLPMILADLKIVESYSYKKDNRLHIPITAFHGINDGFVSELDLRAWDAITKGEFKFHALQGDHLFLHENQSQKVLLKLISKELECYK